MYIYKTTHLPTQQFYVAYEERVMHQSNFDQDPMNVFAPLPAGYNGEMKINNLVKEVIVKVGSKSEAVQSLSEIAKHEQNNPNFLGVKNKKVEEKPITPAEDASSKKPGKPNSGSVSN